MPWIPIIVGAALTVGKAANDQLNANKQNRISADEMQYSPWTHMNMKHMDAKTSDPFGTAAQGGAATSSAYDQALKWGQQGKDLTPIDAKTQSFLDNPSNTDQNFKMPALGSSISPVTSNGNGPLYYKDNGSERYNQGDPAYSLLSANDASKAMGGQNGQYGGYDPYSNGAYWSPYGGR